MTAHEKYSSAPWRAEFEPVWWPWDGAIEITSETGAIAWTCTSLQPEENRANARLIAAAPDMLAALGDVVLALQKLGIDGWSDAPYLMKVCCTAIAKAEGR